MRLRLLFGVLLMGMIAGLGLADFGCSHTSPSAPVPVPTVTNTPTPTLTSGSTMIFTITFTPTSTATNTATNTLTPTQGSPTPTATLTGTSTGTSTPTNTVTHTPTATPTSTGTWFTPTYTLTNCFTPTMTLTGTMVPTPVIQNYISGPLTYTGSGSGTGLLISGGAKIYTFPSSGTYTVGVAGPGVYQLSAYYDYNSPGGGLYYCPTCNFAWSVIPVPGMRYTNSGSCSNPVTVVSYAVTVSGAAGTTTIGPNLSFDNTCSYWGIYGTLSYTGNKGTVQICRGISLCTYLDAAYSIPAPYSTGFTTSSGYYSFVTNLSPGATGLSPLYLRAYFDANGDNVFDTGDPYVDLGSVTPTTDGLLQNISFGDTFIK
jgi:hypothetical protein